MTTLVLGVAVGAGATGATGATPQPIDIVVGARPNQDVTPLYTSRDAAVSAALKKLPGQVRDALARSGVPGAQVAVVSKGRTVYRGSFGYRDVAARAKVDNDTLFLIASLSKPLSGTVVARAITEDPSLSWSTKVSDLMPGFTMNDPYVTANAQIGDYFAHRTGIPTGGGDDLEDLGFDRQYILDHLKYIPLQPFRVTYQYSNFGMTAGAEAVAVSRGQTWEQTAQDLLFTPLGMTSTTASHAAFLAHPNRAIQYARIGEDSFQPLFDRDPDAEAPAGGVASTAGDIARWMALVLADGTLDGTQFIAPEPFSQTFSAQIVSSQPGPIDARAGHYGYGINVGSAAGGRVTLSHSGAFGLGTATAATLIPDLDLGIVVLTNGAPIGVPEAVAQEFVEDVMYGKTTRDWVQTMHGVFAHYNDPSGDLAGKERPAGAAPAGPAADYVGTYESPYFGTLTVRQKDGRLWGVLGPDGGYTFVIDQWNGDTMAFEPHGENALPGSRSSMIFARTGGAVSSVTLTYFNGYAQVAKPSGLGIFTRMS